MNRVYFVVKRYQNYFFSKKMSLWNKEHQKYYDLWDRSFKIPFQDFRENLTKIALSDVCSYDVDGVFNYVDEPALAEIMKEDGVVITGVDDDDWLSPDLFKLLREIDVTDKKIIVHDTLMYEQYLNSVFPFYLTNENVGVEFAIPSCGYSVVTPTDYVHVMHHGAAHTLVDKMIRVEKVYAFCPRIVSSPSVLDYWYKQDKNVEETIIEAVNRLPNPSSPVVPECFRKKWRMLARLLTELKASIR